MAPCACRARGMRWYRRLSSTSYVFPAPPKPLAGAVRPTSLIRAFMAGIDSLRRWFEGHACRARRFLFAIMRPSGRSSARTSTGVADQPAFVSSLKDREFSAVAPRSSLISQARLSQARLVVAVLL
jgi:hypothetical protein